MRELKKEKLTEKEIKTLNKAMNIFSKLTKQDTMIIETWNSNSFNMFRLRAMFRSSKKRPILIDLNKSSNSWQEIYSNKEKENKWYII